MKSKFISPILAIAVVIGMALVPLAVPGQVAVASGNVTVKIDPSTTQVLPGGSFTIDAVIDNPSGMEVAMINMRLDFDPSYFTVDSASLVDFTTDMGAPTIDNVAGQVDYDPNMGTGNSINSTTIIAARISCTAKSLVGASTISWVYESGPPPRYTKVVKGTTDYLEGGNMSLMFNGTVMAGTPTLTVCVNPVGNGRVEANGTPLVMTAGCNTTTWGWDEVVNLKAVDSTCGWGFVNWTGNLTGSTNPTNITMDDFTKNVTANFAELPPALNVTPSSLSLTVAPDATDTTTYTVKNPGGGTLSWNSSNVTYDPDGNMTWLTQNITSGNLSACESNTVLVTANTTGLAEGTYNATINITGGSSVELPVTLNVVLPIISVNPTNLSFVTNEGVNPANQTLEVCNSGSGTLNWTLIDDAAWLSVSPTAGGNLATTECNSTNVTVDVTGLTQGIYHANITIDNTDTGANKTVPVTLSIAPISVSPTSLSFTTTEGENPADQTLEVCNSGSGTLNWSLIDTAGWLGENPTSGSLAEGECENVRVSVDVAGMKAGDYTAKITFTGSAPTQEVPVSLHIESAMMPIPGGPAALSASALSISPQQVKPGQDVTISINVANSGGETGSYNAVLYINSVVEDSQSVSVPGGTSKNVIFTVSKKAAGVYDVSLAGQNGQFEVVGGGGWFGGGGLGTGGIIAIVVIVIVLIVAVIFILRGTTRPE